MSAQASPDGGLLTTALAPLDLTPAEFHEVRELAYRVFGLHLHDGKEGLVRSRLAKRVRALGLGSVSAYLERVRSDGSGAELQQLVDVLTTNKTSFFREARHFEFLRERVFPELAARRVPLRLWSAGCSTGEEPASLAMELLRTFPDAERRDIRILATDISTRVLARAREGVYDADAVQAIDPALLRGFFERTVAADAPRYRLRESVRRLTRFARLNLMETWPMKGPFHAIFCRNVMIYFDRPTQERLVSRFWDVLAPGGYLFVGHSESMSSLRHRFAYVAPAVYLKDAGGPAGGAAE